MQNRLIYILDNVLRFYLIREHLLWEWHPLLPDRLAIMKPVFSVHRVIRQNQPPESAGLQTSGGCCVHRRRFSSSGTHEDTQPVDPHPALPGIRSSDGRICTARVAHRTRSPRDSLYRDTARRSPPARPRCSRRVVLVENIRLDVL